MKKVLALILVCVLSVAAFVGCTPSNAGTNGKLTVGIIQFMQHPSLDEICNSIVDEIKAQGYGEKIEFNIQNAQGDMTNINTICQKFIGDQVDLIVAIATPAAQGAVNATMDIPVIFSAVSDPVGAKLLENMKKPESNVTGTSDAIAVSEIFGLAKNLTPDAKHFGLIYNPGEANSVTVIAQAKEYLDANGYTYTEATVNNTGDVTQAAQSLVGSKVEAIFSPIDNTVATSMKVLSDIAIDAKIPVYVSADSMVNDGGLATVGVNYTDLGKQTAGMVIKVLIEGKQISEIPVEVLNQYTTVVNEETAKAIGVDVSKYTK